MRKLEPPWVSKYIRLDLSSCKIPIYSTKIKYTSCSTLSFSIINLINLALLVWFFNDVFAFKNKTTVWEVRVFAALRFNLLRETRRGDYSTVEPNGTCSAMECIIWHVRYSWPMGVFFVENFDTDCKPHLCYLMPIIEGGGLQRDINAWPTKVSYLKVRLRCTLTYDVHL